MVLNFLCSTGMKSMRGRRMVAFGKLDKE